ncbi:MAG: DUF2867 domain-containing protein [Thermodesulfobacteriota bacterium]
MTGPGPGFEPPEEVASLTGSFDYADHFSARSGKEIRRFLADFFSYRPAWMRTLYVLRRLLAGNLRIEHSLESVRSWRPEDIPFTPGERMWIFTVGAAREGEYWAATADDSHLTAVLAVTREPGGPGLSLYRVSTYVRFKNWRGRVYFALVKPFHKLVVGAMARGAA